ncbi:MULTISPECIES: DUF262 domain-containing protein [unclassified Variovorax]|uniref:DUF262 domain-containing protein n=1 Tax=unclassified Variovorax TaxID=663243 RepID=UPI00076C95EC|nr:MULTISPECIES: DUF262 domain-containing protein [unclassified Variovorax]KWT98479.1 hypothetical protein APY03_0614 [Variovorax sp. WDL1]PNG49846.1 hypothetical protein CHC06_05427 [Variovorax sp. B2]PNG50718.1 hypothetical protein CHC07_05332 [Variovorax sp. B4]VTV17916.1 hypothetical protein WDL1P1_00765 [Variovorax sp. WDL1]
MNIQQNSVFLSNLLKDLTNARLLPAGFQRPYVWTRADVMALLESILRGYPIGAFLLWSPYGRADISQAGRTRLGPVHMLRGDSTSSLLLDGQNRLATLAWVARDEASPLPDDLTTAERAVWADGKALVANLREKKLEFVDQAEADSGFRLPARALLSSLVASPLMRRRWTNEWAGFGETVLNDGLKWFDEASGAFSGARVVVTEMEYATAQEAKDAFLHICKVGVPMAASDFDAALSWVP